MGPDVLCFLRNDGSQVPCSLKREYKIFVTNQCNTCYRVTFHGFANGDGYARKNDSNEIMLIRGRKQEGSDAGSAELSPGMNGFSEGDSSVRRERLT